MGCGGCFCLRSDGICAGEGGDWARVRVSLREAGLETGRGYVFRGGGGGDGMCGRGGNVNVPNKDMQAGLAAGGYGMKAAAARRGYVP